MEGERSPGPGLRAGDRRRRSRSAGIVGFFYNASFGTGDGTARDAVLGILDVNGWHNLVHIASGAIGLLVAALLRRLARLRARARRGLPGGGAARLPRRRRRRDLQPDPGQHRGQLPAPADRDRGGRRRASRRRRTAAAEHRSARARLSAAWLLRWCCSRSAIVVGFVGRSSSSASTATAPRSQLTIDSKAVGRPLPTTVVVPAQRRRRAGGRCWCSCTAARATSTGELDDAFFSALADAGLARPAGRLPLRRRSLLLARPRRRALGHLRDARGDPQVVKRFQADRRRVAIGGISMGGFGAYDIARLQPGPLLRGGRPLAGALAQRRRDGARRLRRRRGLRAPRRHRLRRARTRGASGARGSGSTRATRDPFRPGDEALTQALGERVSAHSWPGGHEGDYWNAHWPRATRASTRAPWTRC